MGLTTNFSNIKEQFNMGQRYTIRVKAPCYQFSQFCKAVNIQ